MASFIVKSAWNSIKPAVREWLTTRALVLPVSKKAEIAKKYAVPVSVVDGINEELIAQAAVQLETFKP